MADQGGNGEPPPPMGVSSWEEAITGMIDDDFNERQAEAAIADALGDGPPPPEADAGPPENILQPAPSGESSSPLIILESLESGGRSDDANSIPKDNSACLDVVSSESSKGSQGSYADQVPSLSVDSGSIAAPKTEEAANRSDLGSPWTLPSDDNSSSSKSEKDTVLVVADEPAPTAEVDVVAEPTPQTGSPSDDPEEDSKKSGEDIDAPVASFTDQPPQLTTSPPDKPEEVEERPVANEVPSQEPVANAPDAEISEPFEIVQREAATDPSQAQADTEKVTDATPTESEQKEEPEKIVPKPAKAAPNLTIKTSFSSQQDTGGALDALQESNTDDGTRNLSASSRDEGGSILSNVSELVSKFTAATPGVKHADSVDLDDILGEKGGKAPLPTPRNQADVALLSPATNDAMIHSLRSERTEAVSVASNQHNPSTRSERTDQLLEVVSEVSEDSGAKRASERALLAASEKELDALTSKKEGALESATEGQPEPSLAELQSQKAEPKKANPLDRIVASLQHHEEQQTRPSYGPGGTPASYQETPMSRQNETPHSYAQSAATSTYDSPGSYQTSESGESDRGASTFWTNSTGVTESNVGTSMGDSFSPTATSIAETDTLSPGATSISRGTFSTAATGTFHTRDTYHSQAITPNSQGGSLSDGPTMTRSETEITETERSGTGRVGLRAASTESETERAGAQIRTAESEPSEAQGGRLWQLANQEAAKNSAVPMTAESSRFAESLMAHTRSRADPDALVTGSTSLDRDAAPPHMVKIGEEDEEKFIVHTALARKRVRVVQLLIVGLLALLVSFLGNLWIQSSCHFVSASVEVGEKSQVFDLHYGLWKYSPIDSAFQGYSYCFQYDDEYTTDAPLLSRWFSCVALVGGSFSLAVLWAYLIFGRGNRCVWHLAVFMAATSGILQLSTLIILAGPVCRRDECSIGPAGILSIVAGVVYFVLAFEMHYNTPMAAWVTELATCPSNERPGNLMANLEMTDFKHGAKAYVSRIVTGDDGPYKSLNQIQRDNRNPMGEGMLDRDLTKSGKAYRPPALIV